MTILLLVILGAAVACGGGIGYGMGLRRGKDGALAALARYEKSIRDMHGNQPTPQTVIELPGLQAAVRYLMKIR